MKKKVPVEKGKCYNLYITSMGYKGEGVGKIDDFTVFVKNAIVGEKVKVKITKVNKRYAFGELLKIENYSPYRVKPKCQTYNNCGGCNIQHINYNAQLNLKKKRVEEVLTRIGNIDVSGNEKNIVKDVIGMKNPYNYRNKIQLPIGKNNNKVSIGFYKEGTHDIVDLKKCYIQDEDADKIINIVKKWIIEFNINVYNEVEDSGLIRHIMIRKGFKTKEIMVVIVTRENNLPYKKELINLLRDNVDDIKSIIQNVNNKNTNVILGEKCETLWGEDFIVDYIGNFKFNISPLSFFQVNPIQTEVLYNKVLEYANLTGNEIVFDAYCGTGTISLFLSQKAKKVYGVEIIPQAIENANINSKENNVNNVEFIVGKSEEIIPQLIKKGIKANVVVVDPPRKGCESNLLETISSMNPKKIVYVSCDPATLARDLNILSNFEYIVKEIQPVDMFPQTSHVETCVLLYNKEYYEKEVKGKVKAEVVTEV
ncbi:23S rRNA (uracil-C(5))-methyltransferase RlmCD [Clostridium acetireducens DSM 10703]|uniref:23S rRNA (Uracil-C(5))-methyltransferase RlmCD n=1 Tax=Clostridium acetireducens DSM 10703 TaxID=1121290 RepID=A0A1E8F1H9_9CLOT|nr:23S rRNA (uracil(1939)-C(5))-methyltransferase RlmD [Clostridium acetireducens]OFI07483.1 23S rRNA (uracil-C(5))-methyltransferase RlmCD [Clostridium acetireducens DSM 10703]